MLFLSSSRRIDRRFAPASSSSNCKIFVNEISMQSRAGQTHNLVGERVLAPTSGPQKRNLLEDLLVENTEYFGDCQGCPRAESTHCGGRWIKSACAYMWVLGGVLLYGSRAAGRTRTWVRSKGTLRCTSDGTYGLSYHQCSSPRYFCY